MEPTNYELVLRDIIKDHLPFDADQVFCFTCKNYFGHNGYSCKRCYICGALFVNERLGTTTPGMCALPDIIINTNSVSDIKQHKSNLRQRKADKISEYFDDYLKNITIVRVDGGVHTKKRNILRDYHQFNDFRSIGVRVVILKNEMIKKKDKPSQRELLLKLKKLTAVDDLSAYEEYLRSKEFEECFLIPMEFFYKKRNI